MRQFFYLWFVIVVGLGCAPCVASAQSNAPQFVPGLLIVKLKKNSAKGLETVSNKTPSVPPGLAGVQKSFGGRLKGTFPEGNRPLQLQAATGGNKSSIDEEIRLSDFISFYYDESIPVARILAALKATGEVEYAEQLPIAYSLYTPNDPRVTSQWYLTRMQTQEAWDINKGNASVVIAVVDESIEYTHPDLIASIAYNTADSINGIDDDGDGYIDNYNGWDLGGAQYLNRVQDNNPSFSGQSHGTWVSGFATATADNGIGIAGTSFGCKLLPIKASADDLGGAVIYGYEGIVYAADHGADVINCSWGSTVPTRFGQDIVNYATQQGALVIAACGNSANETRYYPAAYDNVISVASGASTDIKAANTTYGVTIDVVSPGGGVTTNRGGGYFTSGLFTSFASPIAAGIAGLIKAQYPDYTAQQVGERLRVTCDDISAQNPGFTDKLGKGRINALRALTLTSPALRVSRLSVTDGGDNVPQPGESIQLNPVFRNYLDSATNVQVTLTATDPFVTVLTGTESLGDFATLQAKSALEPFVLQLAAGMPQNYRVQLRFGFTADGYTDYQYKELILNRSFADIENGNLILTLTDVGRFGYADFPSNQLGNGLTVAGGNTVLYEGGLLVGNATNRLLDNVRNDVGGQSADFTNLEPLVIAEPGAAAPIQAYTEYSDEDAGASRLGLRITQHAYAYTSAPDNQFVIMRYTLHNTNSATLSDLYAGLFADWDFGNITGNDTAAYDTTLHLAYTFGVDAGSNPVYAGFVALGPASGVNSFAGSAATFEFTDSSKFKALQAPSQAALQNQDIIQTLSVGPLSLAAGDSTEVAFAIVTASSVQELYDMALAAQDRYACLSSAQDSVLDLSPTEITCGPQLLQANKAGALGYLWSTGDTTASILVDTSGRYSVTILKFNGCSDFGAADITVFPELIPLAQVLADTGTTVVGQPISFRDSTVGATSWAWDFGDGTIDTSRNTTHMYAAPGSYTVTLTIGTGTCTELYTTELTVSVATSLDDELLQSEDFIVFPNPTSEQVFVRRLGHTTGDYELTVTDMQGRVVWQRTTQPNGWAGDLPIVLPGGAGLYQLAIRKGNDQVVYKILRR